MNYKEFRKYVDKNNKNIADKLKDNEEELAFYINLIKRFNDICDEKEKLKKQLEEINKMIEKCGFVNIEQVMLNYCGLLSQQKEFIKYLEDDLLIKYRDMGYRHNIYREILDKYKEIISDKDASNSKKVCKEIEWLEINLNKNGTYQFEMNGQVIDWYHKKSGEHIGIFNVDMIREMVEKEGGDNK